MCCSKSPSLQYVITRVTGNKHCTVDAKLKIIKNLLYSTDNSAQYYVMTYMGKESKKEWEHVMCITDTLCCTVETNTKL